MELKLKTRKVENHIPQQSDWKRVRIKDAAPLQRGFDLTNENLLEGDYPVVYSNGILNYHRNYQVIAPGVVTGRSGTIGRVTYVESNFWPHNTSLWVTDFKGNNPRFIFYLFSSLRFQLMATGSGVPTLNRNDVHDIEIYIPKNFAEQTAIATALSDMDSYIASLEKLIAKKRLIKQGVMQDLLSPVGKDGKMKEGWVVRRLGEVAEIYQPLTISQDVFLPDGYPVYGANGIVGMYDRINHDTWQTTITCRGSTCGTVNKTEDRCWITGNAMVMNVDMNRSIDKLFFYYILSNQDFSKCITGSGQPQIVRSPLWNFEICIPIEISIQSNIAKVLNKIDQEMILLVGLLEKAQLTKQGMMQQLLTGKIRLV